MKPLLKERLAGLRRADVKGFFKVFAGLPVATDFKVGLINFVKLGLLISG